MSIEISEIELSNGLKPISVPADCGRSHLLVRYHGHPVGWIDLWKQTNSAEQMHESILENFGQDLVPLVLKQKIAPMKRETFERPVSIVVGTRDRAEQLECCLAALTSLAYKNYEIIIVDNAPGNDATERLAAKFPVRYVREYRPGLDYARNRGIAEASFEIVAFTDDDARPDSNWLRALNRAFSDPEVAAVTGPVTPAELETDAQVQFEFFYGGMSHGFKKRVIKRDFISEKELLWASSFGVGANMAFRKNVFEKIGLFDVALDVGTPSGGGGDVEMLHRVVARGHTLVYDPEALVWHRHRRDLASFKRQLYHNGTGFGCYLLTCARNRTVGLRSLIFFVVKNWFGAWLLRRLFRRQKLRRRIIVRELLGALASPFAYGAAQRRAKTISKRPRVRIQPVVELRPAK